MKLSCLPVSFFPQLVSREMSIREWAATGKAAGLDAVDLSVLFLESLEESYLDGLREFFEELGLPIAMISTYPDFTHPDPRERERQLVLEKEHIRAAGRLGISLARVTSGQAHPGLKTEDGLRWALEGLKNCEQTAKKAGVKLALENHGKPGCWEFSDFDQPTEIFLALAEGIRDTGIGINFDTANPVVAGDDPLKVLEPVLNQVICVHAADTGSDQALQHVLLGTGLVSFPAVFRRLRRAGYDGWISMEEGSGLGEEGVRRATEYVRSCWDRAGGPT